jgi:hypothetical protein
MTVRRNQTISSSTSKASFHKEKNSGIFFRNFSSSNLTNEGANEALNGGESTKVEESASACYMMKMKLRIQEDHLEKVTREAAFALQQSQEKFAQIQSLLKNVKNLKGHHAHQTQKLQKLHGQTKESEKLVQHLTKEIEKIFRKISIFDKKETKPDASLLNHPVTVHNNIKADVRQLKDDNRILNDENEKRRQEAEQNRRRYQQEGKFFLNFIQKTQLLVDLSKKERDHLEAYQLQYFSQEAT